METVIAGLTRFARRALSADDFRRDVHRFHMLACSDCGPAPTALTVEHHTGSSEGDFRGVVEGRCGRCGREEHLFRFTGNHRQPLRRQEIVCSCGEAAFWAAVCERIEGADGLAGFFDEGVIVVRCAHCSRQQVILNYD